MEGPESWTSQVPSANLVGFPQLARRLPAGSQRAVLPVASWRTLRSSRRAFGARAPPSHTSQPQAWVPPLANLPRVSRPWSTFPRFCWRREFPQPSTIPPRQSRKSLLLCTPRSLPRTTSPTNRPPDLSLSQLAAIFFDRDISLSLSFRPFGPLRQTRRGPIPRLSSPLPVSLPFLNQKQTKQQKKEPHRTATGKTRATF